MKILTLTLGKYKTANAYLKEIQKMREVSSSAKEIILKVPIAKKKKQINVALLAFSDLGLSGVQTTQQIKDAALKQGYGLPDAELALALALEEQEVGDVTIVLHDPIKDAGGYPRRLRASRDGDGRWVHTSWIYPDGRWGGGGAFAFPVSASKLSELKPSILSETLPLELTINNIKYRRV